MKNKLLLVAAIGALTTGLTFAQNGNPTPNAPVHKRAHAGQRFARFLNLTPDQKAQAKQIMADARTQATPLRQQLMQNRQALRDAIKSGNDAQIDQITKADAPLRAQLAAIHAHAMEKIYATLTPDQKAKADQMHRFMGPNGARRRQQAG